MCPIEYIRKHICKTQTACKHIRSPLPPTHTKKNHKILESVKQERKICSAQNTQKNMVKEKNTNHCSCKSTESQKGEAAISTSSTRVLRAPSCVLQFFYCTTFFENCKSQSPYVLLFPFALHFVRGETRPSTGSCFGLQAASIGHALRHFYLFCRCTRNACNQCASSCDCGYGTNN